MKKTIQPQGQIKKFIVFNLVLALIFGQFLFLSNYVRAEDDSLVFNKEIKIDQYSGDKVDFYENEVAFASDYPISIHAFNLNINKKTKFNVTGQHPSMFGNNIVYIDYRGEEGAIYVFDINSEVEVKISMISDLSLVKPIIYENNIVWEDKVGSEHSVYLYDLNTSNKIKIDAITDVLKANPEIYGDKVVYVSSDGTMIEEDGWTTAKNILYVYNINTQQVEELISGTGFAKAKIYGDKVVFTKKDDVFVYDFNSKNETQITNDEYLQADPDIYNNKIVWTDYRNANFYYKNNDIYLYDLDDNKEYKVTSDSSDKAQYGNPIIYGNKIIFVGSYQEKAHDPIYDYFYKVEYQVSNKVDKNVDLNLSKRLAGRLLLQVEQGGAIWYVDNINYQRHQVTWENALTLFQRFTTGITDEDLIKIPVTLESIRFYLDTDGDGYTDRDELYHGFSPYIPGAYQGRFSIDKNFADQLKSRLLLQVNQGGAIWYVDENAIRHNVRWDNLMDLFRALALGITDSDLGEIAIGD